MDTNTAIKKIVDDYFAEKLPESLATKVRSWLLHGKGNRAGKDAALEDAWNRVVRYEKRPRRFARDSFNEIEARLFPEITNEKKRRVTPWQVAAAVVLPLLVAGGGAWLAMARGNGEVPARTVVEASSNSPRHVTLSDGTSMVLNTRSSLAYSEEREVVLKGEAFFKVTKGEKPFVVKAGELVVTVLGTTFNVEAYPDSAQVKVTLFEGKVKLKNKQWSYTMNAGEELSFDMASGERRSTAIDTTMEQPAWCAEHPTTLPISKFDEILSMMAERYGVSIENKRPELNDEVYTFLPSEEDSLEKTLYILQLVSQQFTYKVEDGVVTIE